ncbi:putative AMP-binding enzyme [Mollisia scopiformis]|uniref:Putative AMP-binding enzyme n=1 Tax=Mollisia scopiformis TaxID=149040 RepID=A0A194WYD5_MOLSC|nr:putative AMP-binding enzyme [Mollisia scopiformis]KUJ12950.1 putative AMP-binding enzyme [Mollisia scopiformis]
MTSDSERGKRLLSTTIDSLALTEPDRPWISVPRNDDDLSKGFTDISFKQFSNAINHAAHWLDSSLGKVASKFKAFAYEGPADARLAIITVAAAKVGRKILLPFPLAPAQIKGYLLDKTECTAFIYAETSRHSIQSILDEQPHLRAIVAPPLLEWMTEAQAEPYGFDKSWDEAADDPWIIFHTSGTTGLPKPIIYTNRMMTISDTAEFLPGSNQESQASHFANRRVYSTIPMNHLVGMVVALQGTVWLGTTVVLGPTKSTTPPLAAQVIQHGRVEGLIAPPILIKALSLQPASLHHLRALQFIDFAGAPLDHVTGDLLKGHTKLSPAFGTTEGGPYLTLPCADPNDWAYLRFRPSQGITFQQRSEQFYELVFKKEKDAHWQQIFLLYPELDEYPTKDLFQKHPSKEGLWLYSGRADDMVVLANGNGLHASSMEDIIERHSSVKAALVGGDGRDRPFLLLQASDEVLEVAKERDDVLEVVWSAVEDANSVSSEMVRIDREHVVLSEPARPFLRSGKDTLLRRETVALYKDEIEAIYERSE